MSHDLMPTHLRVFLGLESVVQRERGLPAAASFVGRSAGGAAARLEESKSKPKLKLAADGILFSCGNTNFDEDGTICRWWRDEQFRP